MSINCWEVAGEVAVIEYYIRPITASLPACLHLAPLHHQPSPPPLLSSCTSRLIIIVIIIMYMPCYEEAVAHHHAHAVL